MTRSPSKLVVDKDKGLPDAPVMLTPLRKHQPSPFVNGSRWSLVFTEQPVAEPSHGRPRWVLTLPALVIMLVSFVMATGLLLYLVVRRVPHPGGLSESAVFVSELATDTLLGLTISTIATHAVSISAPFLVSVAAYCVAGKWLQEQEFPHQTRVALPTPLQYGFMAKMLTAPNIVSVFSAGNYMRLSRERIRLPRAFRLALALTSLILGLAYSLILADIWLHGSSSVVQGTLPTAVRATSVGVAFNESLCTGSHACLNGTGGWASDDPWIIQAGALIASNSSDAALSVISVSNTSAFSVVVLKSADASLSFAAPSFGIRAQCASLALNCASPSSCTVHQQLLLAMGGNRTVAANGTSNSTPSNNSTSADYGTKVVPRAVATANPQNVLLQLHWTSAGTSLPANQIAVQTSNGDILAWASCDLMFYNLTLWHHEGTYSILGEPELANPSFANIMQGALVSQLLNSQLASNLQATMLTEPNHAGALAAMNQELSRLSLAMFAGTLQPAASTAQTPTSTSLQTPTSTSLFGRYPLGPVATYLLLLYAYALTAGAIYIWAARLRSLLFRFPEHRTASAVQLAQLRLTDPLTLVAALYPSPSAHDWPSADDPHDLFRESEATARLEVGMADGVNAQPVFGVYRRAWSMELE
ncbi:hypothetical protein B0H10DRAFT_1216529 [Mycena sp. CBHHK59/15]|nr:hypothetical protein B0H10DRAFT_1216529 [Mycena sp. CBHHK59/15]